MGFGEDSRGGRYIVELKFQVSSLFFFFCFIGSLSFSYPLPIPLRFQKSSSVPLFRNVVVLYLIWV